jgi:hypothetical protein
MFFCLIFAHGSLYCIGYIELLSEYLSLHFGNGDIFTPAFVNKKPDLILTVFILERDEFYGFSWYV